MIWAPAFPGQSPVSGVRPGQWLVSPLPHGHWPDVLSAARARLKVVNLGIMAGHYSKFLDSIQFSFCRGSSFVFPLVWNTNGCIQYMTSCQSSWITAILRTDVGVLSEPVRQLNLMELECCHSIITQLYVPAIETTDPALKATTPTI